MLNAIRNGPRPFVLRWLPCILLVVSAPDGRAQAPFRSSLTATVTIPPADRSRKPPFQAGVAADDKARLGCREVSLHWAERTGTARYAVYVSPRSTGPWMILPENNVCARVRWTGRTGLLDTEPTSGAPAVVHRLYYKVFALAGPQGDDTPLDVTDAVAVELP